MKKTLTLCLCLVASPAFAHFGMVIPDTPVIDQGKRQATFSLSFSHPFEGIGMELAKPQDFAVYVKGNKTSLSEKLEATKVMEHPAWQSTYSFQRPGVYSFVMEPMPYWEAAEDVSIIHYTKTIVPAYGDDADWDAPVGLPAEIVPITRPFGNYAGNVFQGQVLINGAPLAHAEVEVELYNQENLQAPTDYHITQVIKADDSGVFTFVCPRAGWWGFAALTEADYTLKSPEGEDKGVEIGAVLWTYMSTYKSLDD